MLHTNGTGSSPVQDTKWSVTIKGFIVGRKRVMGSRPILTSKLECSSVGRERHADTVEVVGSSPIIPTK